MHKLHLTRHQLLVENYKYNFLKLAFYFTFHYYILIYKFRLNYRLPKLLIICGCVPTW